MSQELVASTPPQKWIRRRDRYCRNTLANPKPEPYLAAFPAGDIRVDAQSEHFLNLLVYERAWALCHDEHYDFTQWHWPGTSKEYYTDWQRENRDRLLHAWLLIEPDYLPVGVIGFDWMDWNNIRGGWHLCFVWIADAYRRKGILSKRWPKFIQKYGWFTIEHPLSPAMEAFLLWDLFYS
jgi:acetyltransferase (GNAT) family protein